VPDAAPASPATLSSVHIDGGVEAEAGPASVEPAPLAVTGVGQALKGLALGLVLVAIAVTVFATFSVVSTYRYRLAVEVATPEGLRSGSSVIEVQATRGIGLFGPEAGEISLAAHGEAVAVDLPGGQTLFALLGDPAKPDRATRIASISLQPVSPYKGHDAEALRRNLRALARTGGRAEVPHDQYPLLVRFRDSGNPASVEVVDPRHLAASFGRRVRLRRITVEITGDPVTTGIEARLTWLGRYSEPWLDDRGRSAGGPGLAGQLRHGDFRR
jgi:hypothetical protein